MGVLTVDARKGPVFQDDIVLVARDRRRRVGTLVDAPRSDALQHCLTTDDRRFAATELHRHLAYGEQAKLWNEVALALPFL